MSNVVASYDLTVKATKKNIEMESNEVAQPQQPDTTTMQNLRKTVDKYLKMDENIYEPSSQTQNQPKVHTQPLLGGGKLFGLWITVQYNGQQFSKEVTLSKWTLRGKLSDPKYRTPIRFNVDSDPVDDIEVGFGFFKYGFDEIMPDGSTKNHPAWTTAFDFRQINNGLDNQLGELEVWQEFHIDLGFLTAAGSNLYNTNYQNVVSGNQILNLMMNKKFSFKTESVTKTEVTTQAGMNPIQNNFRYAGVTTDQETTAQQSAQNPVMTQAESDYLVTRVGYRSRYGEKIPMLVEKKFAVSKENIFRPTIFQHEMDPNDIIGTAKNDVLFAFQAWQRGMSVPTYDIEFCVEFDPACYVVTQLSPLSGKTFFYYHGASNEPTDITFSSNLLKGGSTTEEENATFSFTLSLDSVTSELVGPGKYMAFDLNMIGDQNPVGGNFIYYASHKFDVGLKLSSPWFEQSIKLKKIPTVAEFKWDLDLDITIVQGELLYVDTVGYASLTMNSNIEEIKILYPKIDPNKKDVTWFSVKNIPSSRRFEAGASLNINNGSMLQIDAQAYVQHDMSSSIGDITIYYPKPDPDNDPDTVLFQIPSGSFANHGKTSIEGTVYVDPDPDNFFVNPNNYFYAKAERTASSDFGEANFYLPNVEVPLLKVYNIPGNAYGYGKFWWNQLKGHIRAQRWSSSGQKDPIKLSLVFDDLLVSNQLSIGNGYIDMEGKIAEDGYFKFDTANDLLDNTFQISNLATGDSLSIGAGSIAATDFQADWELDTSGPQVKVEDLDLSGSLNLFENFNVNIALTGKNVHFAGTWAVGESAGFEIDFYQAEPTQIDFNLDELVENFKFHGYVIISQHIHFDISWKWKQGSSPTDYGYFTINDNTNQANILAIQLNATYKDRFGADIKILDASLYFKLKWYKEPGQWLPHAWLEYYVGGTIDHVYLLWEYEWHTIIA